MKAAMLGLAAATLVVCGITPVHADPAEAEDTAYRMAKKYVDKGFAMAPTDHSGVIGSGGAVQFLIPVNKGLDYVFLVGTDAMARDVDLYVYDDVGGLILDDRRPGRLAGVQFRSSYNGTAVVYMHMASANGLASWYVLVGRRGVPRQTGPAVPPLDYNPQVPDDPTAPVAPAPTPATPGP
jgi:hypothetical protein